MQDDVVSGAIHKGSLRVASLSAERFLSLYGSSLELRAQVQRLTGFCRLAGKGIVTLHAGKFADMDSVTAGDLFRIRVVRDTADTATGNVHLFALELEET